MKNFILLSMIFSFSMCFTINTYAASAEKATTISKTKKHDFGKKRKRTKKLKSFFKQQKKALKSQLKKMKTSQKSKFNRFLLYLLLTVSILAIIISFILIAASISGLGVGTGIIGLLGLIISMLAYLFATSRI